MGLDELAVMLTGPMADAVADRGDGFDVVLAPEPPLTLWPIAPGPSGPLQAYARGIGATGLAVAGRPPHSENTTSEQLAALRVVADDVTG